MLVGLHDLTDKGGPVQQVGEVGRVKEDGPVGDRSRLLHGPHPLAEQLVLDLFLGLGILQLGLLIRNEGVVLGNDGLGALNLLDLGGNLPVQQAFLLQGLGLVPGDGFELPVQVLDLGGQVSLLLLVFPDLLLQLRGVGRLGGLQHHGEHGQEHHQGQERPLARPPQPCASPCGAFFAGSAWDLPRRSSFSDVQAAELVREVFKPAGICGWPAENHRLR